MLILGVDFETEWLDPVDPAKCKIWEWGVILWDTETNTPLVVESGLVWSDLHKFDPRMKITEAQLKAHATPFAAMWLRLDDLFSRADALCAHNAPFDRGVLTAECKRNNVPVCGGSKALPWVDTSCDLDFPTEIETRKLDFLAPTHGFLNPFAHRAVFDVATMLRVASFYDWETTLKNAQAKKFKVIAKTEKPWLDGGKSKDLARAQGFRWDGQNWTRIMREDKLELSTFPFEIVNMGEITE